MARHDGDGARVKESDTCLATAHHVPRACGVRRYMLMYGAAGVALVPGQHGHSGMGPAPLECPSSGPPSRAAPGPNPFAHSHASCSVLSQPSRLLARRMRHLYILWPRSHRTPSGALPSPLLPLSHSFFLYSFHSTVDVFTPRRVGPSHLQFPYLVQVGTEFQLRDITVIEVDKRST